jgi:ABC-2 type transport system ATP-binding protein
MTKVVVVRNLVKKYRQSKEIAVDDVSFDIGKGEFFTFLGPNGAGKTTTISILTTTLTKTSGEVTVAGYNLDTDQQHIRENIGIIFQNPSLDLNLSAEENIRFHALIYKLYPFRPTFSTMPKSYQDMVMDLAQIVGIKDSIFKPVRTYSGGMKRKLEIVRSLIHHPQILFLDEPTTGLDPLSRRNLWSYLQEVRRRENTTIFLTTHYLEEAEGSDNVAIIDHGKIIALGTPSQIKKNLIHDFVEFTSEKPDDLIKFLKENDYKYDLNGSIKVQISSGQIPNFLRSFKLPVKEIKTHTPTLEEAYLELIKNYEGN